MKADEPVTIPGTIWHVHDKQRPQPRIVMPGTESSQEVPGRAPSDAIILFDGKNLDGWMADAGGGPARWKVEDGYMEVVSGTGNIRSRALLGDCQLHVEWAVPAQVVGDGQNRGNSGVRIMNEYEIQILDGYDNPTFADGATGALYGQCPPLVNACRKPGEWQTYEVIWFVPRFDGERLVSPARVTVFHNGVLVHHDRVLLGPTHQKKWAEYKPQPASGPLVLQEHESPVRFRNIWYRPLTNCDQM